MTWQRQPVLVSAGLVLAAFAVGLAVGARFLQRPIVYREVPVPQSSRAPDSNSTTSTPASPALASNRDGSATSSPSCVDIRDASTLEGKNGCVAGLVLRVYTAASGNSFLDFCQDYRSCPFNSVIFSADKEKFGDVGSLQGKRVEIRGDVVNYRGRPEIILHDPSQVRGAQ